MKMEIKKILSLGDNIYELVFTLGDKELTSKATYKSSIIESVNIGKPLGMIIQENIQYSRKITDVFFRFYRGENISFPVFIGDDFSIKYTKL